MSARAFALLLAALPAAAGAQPPKVQVQVPRGPHYAGVPFEIQLRADGFEEQPPPVAEVPDPAVGALDLLSVSPNVSSSISIVNGRVSQVRRVQFVFRYRFVAEQPGRHEIGPFRVSQAGVERRAPAVAIAVQEVPRSDRLRVEISLPETPLYVGARAPVAVEFWLERELYQSLQDYALRVPLFDRTGSFRFLDDRDATGDTEVTLQTASGALRLKGSLREREQGGRRFLVVRVTRTLLPLEPGSFELSPPSLVVNEGVAFRRDLFGERRPTRVRKLAARGREQRLEVRSVPARGAPPSFAGAVGTGFTLEVEADRTVVQVGEPIALEITVRGAGGLETAGLPPLTAEGLLPPDRFRVPEAEVPGSLEGNAKRFEAVVRVLDEGVDEIPPLAYSWFDPGTGAYETTSSRPVALSVRPAELIDAGDVVSAVPDAPPGAPREAETADARATSRTRGLAPTGADLAIVRDVGRLLAGRAGAWGGRWLPAGLYAGSLLLLGAAVLDHRRQAEDPARAGRRRRLEAELHALREALPLPPERAVQRFAASLRRMRAEAPEGAGPELEAFLGECDARSYAPEAQRATPLPEGFGERALALARELLERAS